jgi:hypothetical protein
MHRLLIVPMGYHPYKTRQPSLETCYHAPRLTLRTRPHRPYLFYLYLGEERELRDSTICDTTKSILIRCCPVGKVLWKNLLLWPCLTLKSPGSTWHCITVLLVEGIPREEDNRVDTSSSSATGARQSLLRTTTTVICNRLGCGWHHWSNLRLLT